MNNEPKTEKKEWINPSLTTYGDMAELTQIKSISLGDLGIFNEFNGSSV